MLYVGHDWHVKGSLFAHVLGLKVALVLSMGLYDMFLQIFLQ